MCLREEAGGMAVFDKNKMKEIIKELFEDGDISIELYQEPYRGDIDYEYARLYARVNIDGVTVFESNAALVKSFV